MPRPNPGESKEAYVSRFMASAEARRDYPDEKQRAAVAYSMWGEPKQNALQICPECGAAMAADPQRANAYNCAGCGYSMRNAAPPADLSAMCKSCLHANSAHDGIGCNEPECSCVASVPDPERANAGLQASDAYQGHAERCPTCMHAADRGGHCDVGRGMLDALLRESGKNRDGRMAGVEPEKGNADETPKRMGVASMLATARQLKEQGRDAREAGRILEEKFPGDEAYDVRAVVMAVWGSGEKKNDGEERQVDPSVAFKSRSGGIPISDDASSFDAHSAACSACAAAGADLDALCAQGRALVDKPLANADDAARAFGIHSEGCKTCANAGADYAALCEDGRSFYGSGEAKNDGVPTGVGTGGAVGGVRGSMGNASDSELARAWDQTFVGSNCDDDFLQLLGLSDKAVAPVGPGAEGCYPWARQPAEVKRIFKESYEDAHENRNTTDEQAWKKLSQEARGPILKKAGVSEEYRHVEMWEAIPEALREKIGRILTGVPGKENDGGDMAGVRGSMDNAGLPPSHFRRPEAKERADQFGIEDVEDGDLTEGGLRAKLTALEEGHHSGSEDLIAALRKKLGMKNAGDGIDAANPPSHAPRVFELGNSADDQAVLGKELYGSPA